jgi:DNA helicase II / ATP-dependent DNA helicase PcrA
MNISEKDLNKEQLKAVKSENPHILILAGAGSGKTRTLTYRIAHLIKKKKVNPTNILAVTFTNKAAREMKERVHSALNIDISKMWIGTFHSMFARILRIETEHLDVERNFTIYDTDDQVNAIKKVMSSLNIAQQLYSPKLFQSKISHAKNRLVFPEDLDRDSMDTTESMLPDVYERYNEYLKVNNALDFDDLLIKPIELFDKHPKILKKYQKKFQYIFIDEYQDTNKAQYTLVSKLVHKKNNICVVGDEDQSIYRWRGADINNILNFSKDYPKAEVIRLEENYRSSKTILDAANAVVTHNKERLGKTLFTNLAEGDKITLLDAQDETDEAKKVVENIHNEMFQKKRNFKDIAILFRTNAQSRALEDEMRRNALSYNIVGGVKFYERKEIKDILAYLKVITNSRDSISLRRIINFPLRGIGDTTVGKIEKYSAALGCSLFEGLGKVTEIGSISAGMANRVVEFFELITKYRELSQKISAAEMASSLAQETGIIDHLKNEYDQYESESRLENVYELFNSIEIFTKEREKENKDSSLSSFLEEVALVSEIDLLDDDKNALTLMTLHSAKGLEFPVVFITGLEMGLFPLQRNTAEPEELEEERRLLYVGMTRAEENLYLTYARTRRRYNSLNITIPSLFLDEIPAQNLKIMTETKAKGATSKTRKQARRKKIMAYFHQEDESQDAGPQYHVGSLVYHETFGKGQIMSVEGQGDKMKVSVNFEGDVSKKLIAQYANLTPLEVSE